MKELLLFSENLEDLFLPQIKRGVLAIKSEIQKIIEKEKILEYKFSPIPYEEINNEIDGVFSEFRLTTESILMMYLIQEINLSVKNAKVNFEDGLNLYKSRENIIQNKTRSFFYGESKKSFLDKIISERNRYLESNSEHGIDLKSRKIFIEDFWNNRVIDFLFGEENFVKEFNLVNHYFIFNKNNLIKNYKN